MAVATDPEHLAAAQALIDARKFELDLRSSGDRLFFVLLNHHGEKDYVWVKMDHRWTGAEDIMQGIRAGAEGGIPWFAILDASGNKLATSNIPESGENIGFPAEESGQKHFTDMLKATRQRMTDQEIQDLVSAIATQNSP